MYVSENATIRSFVRCYVAVADRAFMPGKVSGWALFCPVGWISDSDSRTVARPCCMILTGFGARPPVLLMGVLAVVVLNHVDRLCGLWYYEML